MPAVIIRQRKAIRRKNGVFIYFEGTGIVNFYVNSRYTVLCGIQEIETLIIIIELFAVSNIFIFLIFLDNAGVIVNVKGEMKG